MHDVSGILGEMAGSRQRCMYCEDSRGTQIDHFWPIARYKERTFIWDNMLLVCSACNQKKGDRFDLDASGKPLLIDPTAEEPWDFLYFDSGTGMITARYHPLSGAADPKGKHTTNPWVLPLNIEVITESRKRIHRNLPQSRQSIFSGPDQGYSYSRSGVD